MLRITYVNLIFVVYFQLNLTARFIGVYTELDLLLYQKRTYHDLRAVFKVTRIRACKQGRNFCELEQASTRLNFASKSNKGQILRALDNFKRPFDTPRMGLGWEGGGGE